MRGRGPFGSSLAIDELVSFILTVLLSVEVVLFVLSAQEAKIIAALINKPQRKELAPPEKF